MSYRKTSLHDSLWMAINQTWRKSSKQCSILLLLSIQFHFRTPINLPNGALSENPQHALKCTKSPNTPVQSEYYGTFYTTTVPHNHTTGIFHCLTDRFPFSLWVFEAARLSACTKMAANPAMLLQLMSPHLLVSANFVSASKICLFIRYFHRFIRLTELTQREEEKASWADTEAFVKQDDSIFSTRASSRPLRPSKASSLSTWKDFYWFEQQAHSTLTDWAQSRILDVHLWVNQCRWNHNRFSRPRLYTQNPRATFHSCTNTGYRQQVGNSLKMTRWPSQEVHGQRGIELRQGQRVSKTTPESEPGCTLRNKSCTSQCRC